MARFQREIQALNAYVTILKKYKIQDIKLREHKIIILALMPYLESIPLNGQSYRSAVDDLSKLLSKEEWAICISVIREYFTFWLNDINTIISMNSDGDFQSSSEDWLPETIENINQVLDAVGDFELTEKEQSLLQTYKSGLPKRSNDKFFVHTHLRMASFLLFKMRDMQENNGIALRKIVDEILPLFSTSAEQKIFITVTRQMYYNWGNALVGAEV